jgi:hypothetical protein
VVADESQPPLLDRACEPAHRRASTSYGARLYNRMRPSVLNLLAIRSLPHVAFAAPSEP